MEQVPTTGAQPTDTSWNNEEIAIPVKCNVHPWMHAYIAVVKGPFGESDDTGAFKLDNVPPGTPLTAWQETYGTQTQTVSDSTGKPSHCQFHLQGKVELDGNA